MSDAYLLVLNSNVRFCRKDDYYLNKGSGYLDKEFLVRFVVVK